MLKYKVDISTLWNVSGWVYSTEKPLSQIKVGILYKGVKIVERPPQILRKKLKEMGLHPTGKVGFNFNLGDKIKPKEGDKITITFDGKTIEERVLLIPTGNLSTDVKSVLIVGQGKSGTSKLTYVIASGMNKDTQIHFEPNGIKGLPDIGMHRNLAKNLPMINKSLYGVNQSVKFGAVSQIYDRKIWILRDPRDRVISLMLYRWFKGHNPNPTKFKKALDLVKQKEQNPKSINIKEIWDLVYAPGMYEKRLEEEYIKLDHLLSNLDSTWHIIRYEDMVDNKLSSLNNYLGFETTLDQEVPDNLKRVVRSKGYGNWKNWFTQDDVEFYQPILNPFLSKYFDNLNDWTIEESPTINPSKGSEYMTNLFYGKKK